MEQVPPVGYHPSHVLRWRLTLATAAIVSMIGLLLLPLAVMSGVALIVGFAPALLVSFLALVRARRGELGFWVNEHELRYTRITGHPRRIPWSAIDGFAVLGIGPGRMIVYTRADRPQARTARRAARLFGVPGFGWLDGGRYDFRSVEEACDWLNDQLDRNRRLGRSGFVES